MYTFIFKKIGWKFFVAGAATAVVGSGLVRPAIVSVVKTGLKAQDLASKAWDEAKLQTTSVVGEAKAKHSAEVVGETGDPAVAGDLLMELRQLRQDVVSLKSKLEMQNQAA